jgi:hypothetical protein
LSFFSVPVYYLVIWSEIRHNTREDADLVSNNHLDSLLPAESVPIGENWISVPLTKAVG